MIDPLIAHAQLAMEENFRIREQRRKLLKQNESAVSELRLAVLESAMTRVEIKAWREDRE